VEGDGRRRICKSGRDFADVGFAKCTGCSGVELSRSRCLEIQIDPTDIDFRVDTDPDIVKRFLASPRERVKVVFSTYQSSPVVGQAMGNLKPFDVAIFDEAHKT
jgi:predicted helicase